MSSSISATQMAGVHGHGHHHHKANAAADTDVSGIAQAAKTANTAATASAGTAPATQTPSAGLQKFASELQAILLHAQSGQGGAVQSTAESAGAAGNPAAALDPTQNRVGASGPGQDGPVRQLADRLQDLLGARDRTSGGEAQAAPGSATGTRGGPGVGPGTTPADLQSVLNTLQQTLQQRLAGYAGQPGGTGGMNLTA